MTHFTDLSFDVATLADCSDLCDLIGILFAQEAEFIPDRDAQMRGVAAILADAHIGHILTARADGRVIGMVSLLYTVSTALGAPVAWLEDMVVAPQVRGQGVGGQLLDHALSFARSQGCRRVTLLTDGDNQVAHRFYQKQGFVSSTMVPFRLSLSKNRA